MAEKIAVTGSSVKNKELTPEAVSWENMANGDDYLDDVLHTQRLNKEWENREKAREESNRERNEINAANAAFDAEWEKQAAAMKKTNQKSVLDNPKPVIDDKDLGPKKNVSDNIDSSAKEQSFGSGDDEEIYSAWKETMEKSEDEKKTGYRSPRSEEPLSDNPEEAAFAPGTGSEIPTKNNGGFENINPSQNRPDDYQSLKPKSARPSIFFNIESGNIFSRMKDRAKEMVLRIYDYDQSQEGSESNKVLNRIKIAFNGFWASHHERRAIKQKSRLDESNILINNLNRSIEEMKITLENLQKQGMLGTASVQLEIRAAEERRNKELTKRDAIQTEFENREGRMNNYINKRNQSVDKLVSFYDEKLRPLENELDGLQTQNNRMDIAIARAEMNNREEMLRLQELENSRIRLAESLASIGKSPRAIRINEGVRGLDRIIREGYGKIQENREAWAKRKERINETIAKIDREANPYRDKRESFIRIKNNKPLEMNVETRTKGEYQNIVADNKARIRKSASEETINSDSNSEGIREFRERSSVENLILDWNTYLEGEYKGRMTTGHNSATIDKDNFLRETNSTSSERMDLDVFKDMLEAYYKIIGNKNGELKEVMNRYFQ